MKIQDASLTLFFTGGVSLKTWADVGNLDREVELYKALLEDVKGVNFVTYSKEDRLYSDRLGKIKILPTKWYRRNEFTIAHLLLKHYSEIRKADVLKTNQIFGSEIPIWLKKRFGKPLIARCGYLPSWFLIKANGTEKAIANAKRLEQKAFSTADIGVVTTFKDREYVSREHQISPEKIKVIPNYVPTDIFKPMPDSQKKYDVVFVGRGGRQKNIENLLKALRYLRDNGTKISLLMVGGCCEDEETKQLIKEADLDVTLKGNLPNYELPQHLNQARIFVLPSLYEGHPKALLEAMSCGLPCIGTRVDGIREEINHLENGYLCNTDFNSIAEAIETTLNDKKLQNKIGKNARSYVLQYSLDKILKKELTVIQEVLSL